MINIHCDNCGQSVGLGAKRDGPIRNPETAPKELARGFALFYKGLIDGGVPSLTAHQLALKLMDDWNED